MNFRCCGYHHYGEYLDYIKLLVAAVTQTAQRPFCSAPAAAGRRRMHDKRCTSLKSVMRDQIVALIENEGVTHFITGMALGVDMYAAEIVLDLKSKYPHITLESAIPCETQAIKWSVASRERYYNIAAKCDKETMLQREYTPDCMDKRNRYMVDHADYILAVWNGCPSGTGNTVRYAHKKGKSIIVINPVSLDVTRE